MASKSLSSPHFLLGTELTPFLDAYIGPYKITHCYWTGILLIARVVLLVLFLLNQIQESSPSVNLLVIIIISFILIMWLYFDQWVYIAPRINILEVVSLCIQSMPNIDCNPI